ncbi:MAG: UDP-N-acetylmuramate:L-alanyl-gamma-D-glutamyl-meso-diaminopimelate ligase [Mariprofundales bacterium]
MPRLFISGICGTFMAGVARLAKQSGWQIEGSDSHTYPPMSDYLQHLGIKCYRGFDSAHIQHNKPDLCLIGNALSRTNPEVEYILRHNLPYDSGAAFVERHILPNKHAVVIAGTHGKTSTASLMTYVLEVAGLQPGFLIGGLPNDFGESARLGSGQHFVLEGDEYDTAFFDKRAKFVHYQPRSLILNNLEYDHADIYPDLASIRRQFNHVLRLVPDNGCVVVNADDANLSQVLEAGYWSPCIYFSNLNNKQNKQNTDWQWQAIKADGSQLRLCRHGQIFLETKWQMLGIHHIANACAVTALAHSFGISAVTITKALASFTGVQRRMTLVGEARGVRIFDDFAHHPTAITGVVRAIRANMKDKKDNLWAVLEPRSNTMRSRMHQDTLASSLDAADNVLLLPAAARGLADDKLLDVNQVCQTLRNSGKNALVLPDVTHCVQYLSEHLKEQDVVLIMSNGGFDNIQQKLLQALQNS